MANENTRKNMDNELVKTFMQLTDDDKDKVLEVMRLFFTNPEEARRRMREEMAEA